MSFYYCTRLSSVTNRIHPSPTKKLVSAKWRRLTHTGSEKQRLFLVVQVRWKHLAIEYILTPKLKHFASHISTHKQTRKRHQTHQSIKIPTGIHSCIHPNTFPNSHVHPRYHTSQQQSNYVSHHHTTTIRMVLSNLLDYMKMDFGLEKKQDMAFTMPPNQIYKYPNHSLDYKPPSELNSWPYTKLSK